MSIIYFSVIIPTLNEEKYLPKILNALAIQTFREFEVILVDGESDDKTVKIFKQFEKKFPCSQIFISNKRNVAYQRNWGAENAHGKYLIFFDADVTFDQTFLEEVHLAVVKKNFKLATTYTLPDSKKQIDQIMIVLSNLGQEIAKIINKPFLGEYNTIIDREIFLKLRGFREDVTMSEGHDLAIRAFKRNIETIILAEPKVVISLRRFRSEGTISVFRKYAQTSLYTILRGPITHKMFEYNMGGHVHRKKRRKPDLTKIKTYIRAIEKIDKKINRILGE